MRYTYKTLNLLLFFFGIFSCSNDVDPLQTLGKISKLDISNSSSLLISSGNVGSNGRWINAGKKKLYKVTAEGEIVEVAYIGKSGNIISVNYEPTWIFNLSIDYLIINYGTNEGTFGILVRKSDGATFILPATPAPILYQYFGEPISVDGMGNIYYIEGAKVIKVDTSDPSNITSSVYSVNGDQVGGSFAVDLEGNLAYQGIDAGGFNTLRYKKTGGGVEILAGQTSSAIFWTDFNGTMYYFSSSLWKITASPYTCTSYGTDYAAVGINLLKIKNRGKIISPGGYGISQVYSNDGTTRHIPINTFDLTSIKLTGASEDYYYISGVSAETKPVLLKINPDTDEYTTLINGEFDLYKMTVLKSGEIIFNALRLSDGSIVLGQISTDGEIEILEESLDHEVTSIERID